HLVPAELVTAGARIAAFGRRALVWVAPFVPMRVAVVVKESIHAPARQRFEASVRTKVESLGSSVRSFEYVEDENKAVERARTAAPLGHGGILTRDMRFRFPAYARELEAPEG